LLPPAGEVVETHTHNAPSQEIRVGKKSQEAFESSIESCGEMTKIVFVGGTTLAKLRQQASAMELLDDYGSANIAVEGFQIDTMDHFVRNLELHNLAHASVVIAMIGADNIAKLDKSDAVFESIVAFVETLRQKFDSGMKVVLLTILPRDSAGLNRVISTVNTRLFKYPKTCYNITCIRHNLTLIFTQQIQSLRYGESDRSHLLVP
jgi:hypothetical protein